MISSLWGVETHDRTTGHLSLAIWDHTVLLATRHKWTHPALTPASKAGTRFTYPGGMEGWVDLELIATERNARTSETLCWIVSLSLLLKAHVLRPVYSVVLMIIPCCALTNGRYYRRRWLVIRRLLRTHAVGRCAPSPRRCVNKRQQWMCVTPWIEFVWISAFIWRNCCLSWSVLVDR